MESVYLFNSFLRFLSKLGIPFLSVLARIVKSRKIRTSFFYLLATPITLLGKRSFCCSIDCLRGMTRSEGSNSSFIFFSICSYDDEAERITQYERIVLEDLEKIEIGEEFTHSRTYNRRQNLWHINLFPLPITSFFISVFLGKVAYSPPPPQKFCVFCHLLASNRKRWGKRFMSAILSVVQTVLLFDT